MDCEKDGHSEVVVLESSVNGYMFGNILLGGLIGALVDVGSGSAFDYDTVLTNPLRCDENLKSTQAKPEVLEEKKEEETKDLWADE